MLFGAQKDWVGWFLWDIIMLLLLSLNINKQNNDENKPFFICKCGKLHFIIIVEHFYKEKLKPFSKMRISRSRNVFVNFFYSVLNCHLQTFVAFLCKHFIWNSRQLKKQTWISEIQNQIEQVRLIVWKVDAYFFKWLQSCVRKHLRDVFFALE